MRRTERWPLRVLLALTLLGVVGCGWDEIDTTYGRARGPSINGTSALASLVRAQGHEVRVAARTNETLADWAEILVRFAPYPGPPAEREARWLADWLHSKPGRKLVYIPQDCDGTTEFYNLFLAEMGPDAPSADRRKAEARRDSGRQWVEHLPGKPNQVARIHEWFGVTPTRTGKPGDVATCARLTGPWSDGVDAPLAALPDHEAIRIEGDEAVLLRGDGRDLAVSWRLVDEDGDETGAVLVLANGAYLLNSGLLNPARRVLADRVVDWIGAGSTHVAFLEGSYVGVDPPKGENSPFRLLSIEPFNWIAGHLGAFGLLFCLALAVRLGRPRPEPPEGIERSSAHPIALGAVLARTRQTEVASTILADYRRWRQPTTGPAVDLTLSPNPAPPTKPDPAPEL